MGRGIYIDQFMGAPTKGLLRKEDYEIRVELGECPELDFETDPEVIGWHVSYGKQSGFYLWWGQRISRSWGTVTEFQNSIMTSAVVNRFRLYKELPPDQQALLEGFSHWIAADND